MELEKKSRKQLQQLSKKHGIPANLASLELIARLKLVLQVEEKVPKKVSKSAPKKVTFKLDRGHDNKDVIVVEDSSGGKNLNNNRKVSKGGSSRNEVRDVCNSDVEVVADEVVQVRSKRYRGEELVVKDVLPVRMLSKRSKSGLDVPGVGVSRQEFVEEATLVPARNTRLVGGNPVTVVGSSAEKVVMPTRRSTRGRTTVETVNVEVVSVDSSSPVVIRGRRGAKARNSLAVVEHVGTSKVLKKALEAPMRTTRARARGSTGPELVIYEQPPVSKKIRAGVTDKSNVESILEMVEHMGISKISEKVPVVPVRTTRARARPLVGFELVLNEQPPVSKKAKLGAESKSNTETSQEIVVHVETSKVSEEVLKVPVGPTRARARGSTGSELVIHKLPPASKKARRVVETESNVVSIPARMTRARYSMVPSVDQEKGIVSSPPVTKKKAGKNELKEHVVKQRSSHIVKDPPKITSCDITIVESKVETNATDTSLPKDKASNRRKDVIGDINSSETVSLSLPEQLRRSGRSSSKESADANTSVSGSVEVCQSKVVSSKNTAGLKNEPKTVRPKNSAAGKRQGPSGCMHVAEDVESGELGENSQLILSTIKEVPDEACDDLGSCRGLLKKRNIVCTVSGVKPDNSTVSVSDCVFSESPIQPHLQQSDIPLSKNYSVKICDNDIGTNHETMNMVEVTSNTSKLDAGNGSQLCHLKDNTEKVVQGGNIYDLEEPLNNTAKQLVESEGTEKLAILEKFDDIISRVQAEISEPHYASVDQFVGETTCSQSSLLLLEHDSIEAGDSDVRKKHEATNILKLVSVNSELDTEKSTNMCQPEENTLEVAQVKNIFNSDKETLGKAEEGYPESVNVNSDLKMHHKEDDLEEAEEHLKKTEECELKNILVGSINSPTQQKKFPVPPLVDSVHDVVSRTARLKSNFPCSKDDSIDRGDNVGNINSETADLVTHAIDTFKLDAQAGINMYHPGYKIEVTQGKSISELEGEPRKEIVEVEEKCGDLTEKVEECDTGSADEYNTKIGGCAASSLLVKSPATNQLRNLGEADCEDNDLSTFTVPEVSKAEVLGDAGDEQNAPFSVMKSPSIHQIRNIREEDCDFAGLTGLCRIFTTSAVSQDDVGANEKEDRGVFEENSGRQLMEVQGFLNAEDFYLHGESSRSFAQYVPSKNAMDDGCLENVMNHEFISTAELSVEDYIVIPSKPKNCRVSDVDKEVRVGCMESYGGKDVSTAASENFEEMSGTRVAVQFSEDVNGNKEKQMNNVIDMCEVVDIEFSNEKKENIEFAVGDSKVVIGGETASFMLPRTPAVHPMKNKCEVGSNHGRIPISQADTSDSLIDGNVEGSKSEIYTVMTEVDIFGPEQENIELYSAEPEAQDDYLDYLDIPETTEPDEAYIGNSSVSDSLPTSETGQVLVDSNNQAAENNYEFSFDKNDLFNIGSAAQCTTQTTLVNKEVYRSNEHGLHEYSLEEAGASSFSSPQPMLHSNNRYEILAGLDTASKTNVGCSLRNPGNVDRVEGQGVSTEAKHNEQSSPNNSFLSPPSILPTKNRFDILTGLETALKTNVGRRLKNSGSADSLEGQDGDKDFCL